MSEGCCTLHHRGFPALGDIVFQRSDADGVPVALIPLGGRPVSFPMRALQRELDIDDDSEDGRMLALIAEALDYVTDLRPGDRLPAEVLTGEASWEPRPAHVEAARRRLYAQFFLWAEADPAEGIDPVFDKAAAAVGMPDRAAIHALVEQLVAELAYIEALREGFLHRVQGLSARLERLARGNVGSSRIDALVQSRRMLATALLRIGSRFADIAAKSGQVLTMLKNVDGQRTFIRSNRDWLHRSRLAWEALLRAWEAVPEIADEGALWPLLPQTYRFLAQRFMSTQEWRTAEMKFDQTKPKAMNW